MSGDKWTIVMDFGLDTYHTALNSLLSNLDSLRQVLVAEHFLKAFDPPVNFNASVSV
jgi:hypothetical protein